MPKRYFICTEEEINGMENGSGKKYKKCCGGNK